jgi:hypothetical protein
MENVVTNNLSRRRDENISSRTGSFCLSGGLGIFVRNDSREDQVMFDELDAINAVIRQERTFAVSDVESMPWLPKRATIDEFKEYGMVNLVHTQRRGAKPWVKAARYKLVRGGRVYVLEIGQNTTRGQAQSAWLYKPVVRVPSARCLR